MSSLGPQQPQPGALLIGTSAFEATRVEKQLGSTRILQTVQDGFGGSDNGRESEQRRDSSSPLSSDHHTFMFPADFVMLWIKDSLSFQESQRIAEDLLQIDHL